MPPLGSRPPRLSVSVAEQRPQQPARGALLEIALVVLLGAPERSGRLDLGHDRVAKAGLRPLDDLLGDLRLLVGVGKDDGAVLPADVRALAIELGRVVQLEVLGDQILVADLGGVERYLGALDVPGVARADLLVRWVVDVAALVADRRVDDAVDLAKRCLDLPEAAGAEGGLLGLRLCGGAVLGGHGTPSKSLAIQ